MARSSHRRNTHGDPPVETNDDDPRPPEEEREDEDPEEEAREDQDPEEEDSNDEDLEEEEEVADAVGADDPNLPPGHCILV